MDNTVAKQRFYELDIMRALAIAIIIFHHLPDFTFNFFDLRNFGINLNLSPLNSLNTYFGLGLFMYISGVLLRNSYSDFSRPGQARNYIGKRFFRIFPLYWAALILFSIFTKPDILGIFLHLLGLQLIFKTPLHQPIFTIWYLGLITIYYWFFILIAKARYNAPLRFLAILALPAIVILLRAEWGISDIRLLLYYLVFLSGLFGETFFQSIRSSYKKMAGLAVFFVFSVFAFISMFQIPVFHREFYPYALTIGGDNFFTHLPMAGYISAMALINCIAVSFAFLVRLAAYKAVGFSKYFNWLAYSSYCIYLFHRPVWITLLTLHYSDDPRTRLLYLSSLGIGLTLLVSYAMQKTYDKLLLWSKT